ncbi:MAG: heme A synthase [Dehalococcoidia bacterium]|nr:heme A synthase [Dehalococcoidia bacterium]
MAFVSALGVVIAGGIVRVTGSGLGCPDWPLCHGHIIPPPDIKAWTEYSHRLSVSLLSVFTVFLLITGYARYRMSREFALLVLSFVLLVVQALFGAATVQTELSPGVALAHTGIAMALVGTLALIVSGTSPWSTGFANRVRYALARHANAGRYRRAALILLLLTYVLLLTGSYVYRSGASLACLGFPLCDTPVGAGRRLQDIHMLHRYAAGVVALAAVLTVWLTWRLDLPTRRLKWLASIMFTLMAVPVALGAGNVLFQLPDWARLGHLITASLVFGSVVLLVGTVWRRADA